jgi:hypothetical protein
MAGNLARRVGGMMAGGAAACIACYTPTETALGYFGSVEGHAAFLTVLGVPEREAVAAAELSPLRPTDTDPDHPARYQTPYRVCSDCAAKAKVPAPVLIEDGAAIPAITAKNDARPI